MSQRWAMILLVPLLLVITYAIAADAPPATVEQRLRALEAKVDNLERRLKASESSTAVASPAASAQPAAAAASPAGPTVVTESAAPSQAVASPQSQAPAQWHALKRGMSWSQVIELLGKPGKKRVSPMTETWYYPDSDGGSIEFDRDGRVSGWSEP